MDNISKSFVRPQYVPVSGKPFQTIEVKISGTRAIQYHLSLGECCEHFICECVLNVLKETVPVSKSAKRKLGRP